MRIHHLSLVLCFGAVSLFAADPSVQELTDQLQKAAAKTVKEKKEKAETDPSARSMDISPYLGQLGTIVRQAQTRGDTSSVQQVVGQIQSLLASEEINQLAEALLAQLQKEIVDREQAYIGSVDTAVEKAVVQCFVAKEPKELDAFIIELSKSAMGENYNSSFEPSRRSAEKARAAVTFMCRWQDYLLQIKSGNIDAASSVLRSLSQDTSSYPFVPRSQILERIEPQTSSSDDGAPETPNVPTLKGKTLADIEALKDTIREQLYRTPTSQPARQFSEQLTALDRAYEQLHAGLVGKAFSYCTNPFGGNAEEEFLPLKQALLLEVLPIYLNIAEIYPPASKDTPAEYLVRVVQEARAKGDWVTVWKTLEAYRAVAFSGKAPSWLNADIQGTSQFIVAQNLEKAEQWVDAIKVYRQVLSLSGENLPVKEATERLSVLQKDHAADYEAATKPAGPPATRFNPR